MQTKTDNQIDNHHGNDHDDHSHDDNHDDGNSTISQKSLAIKFVVIALLCAFFLVGLGMIKMMVYERQTRHEEVISEIKNSHVAHQIVVTPFLLAQTDDGIGQVQTPIFAKSSQMNADSTVSDDVYKKDIYRAISYQANFHIEQQFEPNDLNNPNALPNAQSLADSPVAQLVNDDPNFAFAAAAINDRQLPAQVQQKLYYILPISDLRGVVPSDVIINNQRYPLKFGDDAIVGVPNYLMADLTKVDFDPSNPAKITLDIEIAGIDNLAVVPTGQNANFKMNSNWSDPKFSGTLPAQKSLGNPTKAGFDALWQSDFDAQDNTKQLSLAIGCTQECSPDVLGNLGAFDTQFFVKSDNYTQTDRSIKYAIVLLIVSFGAFFLFECMKNLQIHPIQYSLVAAALLVFYVILLSLSEYIAFWQAYAIASAACIMLIGWYAFYMLKSTKRALAFAVVLMALYGSFYVILASQAFSLLIGSLFCFVLVFAAMFLTRHINGYVYQ